MSGTAPLTAELFASMLQSALGGEPGTRSRIGALIRSGVNEAINSDTYKQNYSSLWAEQMPKIMNPIMDGTTQQLRDFHNVAESKLQSVFQAAEANITSTFMKHESMATQHEQILGDIKKQAAEMQDMMSAIALKMGTAGTELDDRHAKITAALQILSDKIARAERDLAAVAGSYQAGGGGVGQGTGKIDRLNNPKETTVKELPENLTRADFGFWVELLYSHLENYNVHWRGVGHLLREVRQVKEEIDDNIIDRCMDQAEHKSEGKFRRSMFDHYARGDELYTYLTHRVNKRHKALVVDTKNGFEVFRRVAR